MLLSFVVILNIDQIIQKIENKFRRFKNKNFEIENFENDKIYNSENIILSNKKYEYYTNSIKTNKKIKKVHSEQKKFIIKSLGDIPEKDLHTAGRILNDFFGYESEIGEKMEIRSNFLTNDRTGIEASTCLSNLSDGTYTVVLTKENLYDNGVLLRGYTTMNGRTILMRNKESFLKETLIHEIGHTLGLDHCDNLSCIMAINNDEQDSGDFCEICKLNVNY